MWRSSSLAHASRLALAGELVASIAHEVKQPLTAIIANTDAGLLMLESGSPNATVELRAIMTDVGNEGRLAGDIVSRLGSLVRKQPVTRTALDLSELALETLRLIKSEVQRRQVVVQTELASSLPAIQADRVSLQQVLLNLVFNAMDAMKEIDDLERRIDVRTRRGDGGVELAVCDSGCGIPKEQLSQIFDPFFTTKSEGIGLGLVIAKTIVEEHRGTIWADNNTGGGATFHVRLPSL